MSQDPKVRLEPNIRRKRREMSWSSQLFGMYRRRERRNGREKREMGTFFMDK
jgi:hypothetical protein